MAADSDFYSPFRYVLIDEKQARTEKTIALQHADLLTVTRETGRTLDDSWCARIAAKHLIHLIETGEDMEKDLVTVSLAELRRLASAEKTSEQAAVSAK
jgi:hypothetical protein